MAANVYECMVLFDSNKYAGDSAGLVNQVHTILQKHQAEVLASRPWDERRLAYNIGKHKKGTYYLIYFKAEGKAIRPIEADFHLSEPMLRFIILRIDPKLVDTMLALATLPADARVVDAGCGLGDGLHALAREYPQARLVGWEWSRPLAWLCAWRCRRLPAEVRRADIWRQDWSGFALVYLFQRPESMPRALAKARAELSPGAFLVSLEFEIPQWRPLTRLENVAGKPVWVYRVGEGATRT